jgi:drug/metabolite transporter (DMT)-like permease
MSPGLLAALIVSATCAAFGQILLKAGATGRAAPLDFLNPSVVGGLALYGLGVALWLFALSKLPLTVVYPFTLLTLGIVAVLGVVLLGERPTPLALAGWAIAALGLCVVWLGSRA